MTKPAAGADSITSFDVDRTDGLTGLPQRAVAAARAADAVLGSAPLPDREWHERAAKVTRTLATTLGIHPGTVIARPDTLRARGLTRAPEVQLAVIQTLADAGLASFDDLLFIPDFGRADVFLWLLPCLGCRQLVPTYRIASLVDFGRHIDPETIATIEPDTEQFATDPAHVRGCRCRRDWRSPDPADALRSSRRRVGRR